MELEELKEQYDIHRANIIKGYEDFMMTKDNFLYTSDFSWELKSYQIFSQYMPETTELIDQIMKYCNAIEYTF